LDFLLLLLSDVCYNKLLLFLIIIKKILLDFFFLVSSDEVDRIRKRIWILLDNKQKKAKSERIVYVYFSIWLYYYIMCGSYLAASSNYKWENATPPPINLEHLSCQEIKEHNK